MTTNHQSTHYDVLGIGQQADLEQIKTAYRQQIRQSHPDRFASQRVQLQRTGDETALRTLDAQIDRAKKQTQRINEAYRILSDPVKRADYDRQIRPPEPSYNPYTGTYSTPPTDRNPYAGVYQQSHARTEPHAPPTPQPQVEPVPWAIFAVLTIALLMVFAGLTNFLVSDPDYVVSSSATPAGYLPAGSVDATASALANITPIPTRNADVAIRSADILYDEGLYQDAVDLYSEALDKGGATVELHYKRALAYAAQVENVDDTQVGAALSDFNAALRLNESRVDVRQSRAWFYYRLWQLSGLRDLGQSALSDFNRVVATQSRPDREIQAAISTLQTALNG